MKLVLFCLLAGVFPGWSETRGATFAPITLYTQFQQAPPDGVLEALQDEVESIMAPIGLRFEWRDLAKAGGTRSFRGTGSGVVSREGATPRA